MAQFSKIKKKKNNKQFENRNYISNYATYEQEKSKYSLKQLILNFSDFNFYQKNFVPSFQ